MKLTLGTGDLARQRCDALLVPVFEGDFKNGQKARGLKALDQAMDGQLAKAAAAEDFSGKAEQTVVLQTYGRIGAQRLILVGLGAREKHSLETIRLALGRGVKTAQKSGAASLIVAVPETESLDAILRACAEGLLLGAYRFERYKAQEKEPKARLLKEVKLFLPPGVERSRPLQQALELGTEVAEGTNFARDLVNEPANTMTPRELADAAKELARERGLEIEVLEKNRIERLNMGLFLAVARGSVEPPVLVHLWYEPAGKKAKAAPLALVGKGITFDSGGLSLKPSDSMQGMKTDMGGAAAVLGAMRVVAARRPPFPVHAYFGACENMPSGNAVRIGDVIRSRSGKTVEITNTDAEGRLLLADVLTWAGESKPAAIVDLATLTGACVVALGLHMTGVFGVDEGFVGEVLEATQKAGEEAWRLPISDLQRDAIKSDVADMKNSGDRWGGAINAALFLREFVGDVPWVHLDIAGPVSSAKERGYLGKGAPGAGVRTLVELVRGRMK